MFLFEFIIAEELGVMPALLFVEHGCVPILLKLLMKNNTACTAAIFEILLHIGSEKGRKEETKKKNKEKKKKKEKLRLL